MKKITVEARLLDKSLGCNFYETLAVDAEDGREAMSIVHSLLVDRYRTDAFISRLQVIKTEELETVAVECKLAKGSAE